MPTPDNDGDRGLTPRFLIEGRDVFLNPLRILTVLPSALGRMVDSLAEDPFSTQITNAIDLVISRAYR